jgi:hypothetical protein
VARYTRQPRLPTDGPVDLHEFWARSWRVDVLRGKRSPRPSAAHQQRTAERLGGTYREIDAGHYPMLSNVGEMASYLREMA